MSAKFEGDRPKSLLKLGTATLIGASAAVLISGPALAEVDPEVAYIFNTLLFLIGGFLVMLMAAGFAMLEAGLVRTKHTAAICLKNIGLYSIAGVMYYVIGYQLMYNLTDTGLTSDYFGVPGLWAGSEAAGGEGVNLEDGYASSSDWFFQMVFVATAASIVSGAIAERVKLISFFIFVAVLTAFIYPIGGAWQWGEGWLYQMGFSDFAGSTIVHSVGGWAALAGCLLVGPRMGRYVDGRAVDLPGSSLPLATLGTFLLWFGWFGFNGASQLAMGSAADASDIARIFANTNMAAAGGVVTTIILTKIWARKVNLGLALNGALAGLVAITAEPLQPAIWQAILIGGVGAVIATGGLFLLVRLGIDDVVGAIPVHLFAGIFGTMIVPWTNSETSYLVQAIGVASFGGFAFVSSFIVWLALRNSIGIRMSREDEEVGGDLTELGHEAYPEFVPGNGRALA